MSDVRVTVLMGVFNAQAEVDDAIRSILSQTFRDFEFLIIDDASTDGSVEIIEKYAAADSRIRVLRNDVNAGLGSVLNRGVHEARGSLIARMDADDIALPLRLQRQVQFFDSFPETDVLGSYALDIGKDGRVLRERRVPVSHQKIVELIWSNPFIHTTVMFKRESILRAGSYSSQIRRRQDYDLWFRCVRDGLRFANIPEPLVKYRFSGETMRRNHFAATLDQVKIGLRGCRMVRAPWGAYVGTCIPLLESAMPNGLRRRVQGLKKRFDPRARA